MPRAGTRSQGQPSQTQPRNAPRATQSQRPRRSRADADEDEEMEVDDTNDMAVDQDDGDDSGEAAELERKASDLVRLAIFSEQRRMPLKRDEISKKVLGGKSRSFANVMNRAQVILQQTFGMELVELRDVPETDDSNQKEIEAMNVKKKATSSGTKSFILRSTLPPALIELAAAPDGEILAAEMANYDGTNLDDNDAQKLSTGSIISWNTSDELGSLGILYVILALILVSGRIIPENELRKHLKKLRLTPTGQIQLTAQSTQTLTLDTLLNQFLRQNYLNRLRVGGKTQGNKKRTRNIATAQTQRRGGGGDEEDDASNWEWRWGPRAMTEVGEVGIAKFVAEFMSLRIPLEAGDADGPSKKAQIAKRVDALMGGIQKAAGDTELVNITM